MASVPQTTSNARQDLYRRMDKFNTAPLWEVLHALIPDTPATRCQPYLWKYKDVRPFITEAGKLITAKEAIRRVLVLENPGMVYAGLLIGLSCGAGWTFKWWRPHDPNEPVIPFEAVWPVIGDEV